LKIFSHSYYTLHLYKKALSFPIPSRRKYIHTGLNHVSTLTTVSEQESVSDTHTLAQYNWNLFRRNLFFYTVPTRPAVFIICTKRRHLATRPTVTTIRQLHYKYERGAWRRRHFSLSCLICSPQSSCFMRGVTIRFATQLRQRICLLKHTRSRVLQDHHRGWLVYSSFLSIPP